MTELLLGLGLDMLLIAWSTVVKSGPWFAEVWTTGVCLAKTLKVNNEKQRIYYSILVFKTNFRHDCNKSKISYIESG